MFDLRSNRDDSTFWDPRIAGLIGNILDHYDNALFGLLAPFIAPLFFNPADPVTALILTFGMLPLGLLTRPLGSLVFGWIGDRRGRREALFYSLLGMAAVTFLIGCIPLYREIGFWAPLCLAVCKMLQSFFAAGESTGGAIFILEHTKKSDRNFYSGLFDSSTVGGILIASGIVACLSTLYPQSVEIWWRFLFWGSSATAVFGLLLRFKTKEGNEFIAAPKEYRLISKNRKALFSIILVSGFSYTTYPLAFTLMNGYVPLVTNLSKSDVMQANTALLLLDLFLLPCFGLLAQKIGREKIMIWAALFAALSSIPLFALLNHASMPQVILIRTAIVLFGVAFSASYYAWALDQVPPSARYTILSLGYTIGSQLIGAPAAALCLWLYQKTSWTCAPGLYLMPIALAASYTIYQNRVISRIRASSEDMTPNPPAFERSTFGKESS